MTENKPFALHITWTCYGTWLPGDARGYVSNTLKPGGGFKLKQNIPGTPYTTDDPYTRERAWTLQKDASVLLNEEQAIVAAEALIEAAAKRSWRIVRAALMANHVHVVIMDCPPNGEAVRRVLKGVSQAALSDRHTHTRRWWTAGGSNRYKNDWPAIEAAVRYVADQDHKLVEIIGMGFHRCTNDERRGLSPP